MKKKTKEKDFLSYKELEQKCKELLYKLKQQKFDYYKKEKEKEK